MSHDDDYHVSGEYHAAIAAKAIKHTSTIFQERMQTLAMAIALCRSEFDGSMLRELYEQVYVPLANDGTLAWEDRENLFPKPRDCNYTRDGKLKVQGTLSDQRNYFTSASKVYLFPLGIPLGQVVPHRKGTHAMVLSYKSDLYGSATSKRVSPKLRSAIDKMLEK